MRQVTHALLTRPPLSHPKWFLSQQAGPFIGRDASFDLHVLSTPPAFILSQDQTLMLKNFTFSKIRNTRMVFPKSDRQNKACEAISSSEAITLFLYIRSIYGVSFWNFSAVPFGVLLNWIGFWFKNLIPKNVFLEFFKVVSLFSYQGSHHRLYTAKRLFFLLPLSVFSASARIILPESFRIVNTFFQFFSKKYNFILICYMLVLCVCFLTRRRGYYKSANRSPIVWFVNLSDHNSFK